MSVILIAHRKASKRPRDISAALDIVADIGHFSSWGSAAETSENA